MKYTLEPEWKQWRHIRYSRYKELLCIPYYYVKGILTFESYYPLLLQTIPLWYQLCIKNKTEKSASPGI